MGNATWVCFECRTAVRRSTMFDGVVPCSTCRGACTYLGYKIPVPPKSRVHDWEALRSQLRQERGERASSARATSTRHRHDIEREIARLDAMPVNAGRKKAIALLKKHLRDLARD